MTTVFSPHDNPFTFLFGGGEHTLAPNAETELDDDVAAHVLRRHYFSGIRKLTGNSELDKEIRKQAERTHSEWLLSLGRSAGLVPKAEPKNYSLKAALEKRGLIPQAEE